MRIKDWGKFQHFRDRRPPWIKLYRDLLDDEEYYNLPAQSAKVLTLLWLLASEDPTKQGLLPSSQKIAFRLRLSEKSVESILSDLHHWLIQDDITLSSQGCHDVLSEGEIKAELKTEEETALAQQSLMVDTVVDLWNKIPGVVKPKSITGPIRKRLLACLDKQPDLVWWTTYFDKIKDSAFLTGRKTDFAATLDWVLGPKNMAKILAGNYDDREPVIKESAIMEQARAFLGRG